VSKDGQLCWVNIERCALNVRLSRDDEGAWTVRNAECTIYITTKRGFEQRYRRAKDGWTQTGPNGVVRPMTAEQLLSHLLPPLASGRLRVRVEPDVIEKQA
jgi:hypothetical protein